MSDAPKWGADGGMRLSRGTWDPSNYAVPPDAPNVWDAGQYAVLPANHSPTVTKEATLVKPWSHQYEVPVAQSYDHMVAVNRLNAVPDHPALGPAQLEYDYLAYTGDGQTSSTKPPLPPRRRTFMSANWRFLLVVLLVVVIAGVLIALGASGRFSGSPSAAAAMETTSTSASKSTQTTALISSAPTKTTITTTSTSANCAST